jgi:hypothetical protein
MHFRTCGSCNLTTSRQNTCRSNCEASLKSSPTAEAPNWRLKNDKTTVAPISDASDDDMVYTPDNSRSCHNFSRAQNQRITSNFGYRFSARKGHLFHGSSSDNFLRLLRRQGRFLSDTGPNSQAAGEDATFPRARWCRHTAAAERSSLKPMLPRA